MAVYNIFSKRQKTKRQGATDIFTYEEIPNPLRVQIVHIIKDALGNQHNAETVLTQIHDILCREYGVFYLHDKNSLRGDALLNHFLNENDYEKVLDIVEKCCEVIDKVVREQVIYDAKISADDAIKEVNDRFLEHGIGYQYVSGEIVKVDSQYLHQEAVKPALYLLSYSEYSGANEEFLKAHEHYRHKRYKESINECLKSFESTIKTICKRNKWPCSDTDTAKKLISILNDHHFYPSFLESQFASLRALLESGIPTVRNKLSSHGQGTELSKVQGYWASYVLQLTATNILFLINCEQELKNPSR